MNSIGNLLMKPFVSYSLEEQLEIKKLGRPLPDLDLSQQQTISAASTSSTSKTRTRKFNRNIYLKKSWLCGCDEKQAVFCFPCVLFGGELQWAENGVTDLVHMWEKIRTHEKSKAHLNNVFSLSMLGKSSILTELNYRNAIVEHNERVDKNRYVLNIIINCIRFCGALELALHDKSDELESKGVFGELVNFSAHLDKDLRDHFNKSTVFEGSSDIIKNELLECMLDVYHKEVAKEIEEVEFVALIVDETSDVYGEFQLVIILRYIVGGNPVERFWNFVNPSGYDAASISDCILKEIDPLLSDTPTKLISQSYDGPSVMSEGLDGVQKIIRDKYPSANYVHYYAHPMNLIMRSAASVNKSVRIFFAHLSGLCTFFSSSAQRIQVLDKIVNGRSPRFLQTTWNFHSRGVNTVYQYRKELIDVMEILENSEHELDFTIEQAGAYKLRLQNEDFVFWLTIFHEIMPHVEIIFEELQEENTDSAKVKRNLDHFESEIQKIRDQMNQIVENVDLEFSPDEAVIPRKKFRTFEPLEKQREAIEMCDVIVEQIRTRFSFTGHLLVANLFLPEKFAKYATKLRFPEMLIREVVSAYSFLDKAKLWVELQVIYEREELRSVSGALSLLSLMSQEEMRDTFQETRKLLEVLVTTPMATAEAERCFSMLKRIRTFLRNSMKEERLGALGMLSAEKVFLNNIENFNKQVIDLFANQEKGRMDFNYRAV